MNEIINDMGLNMKRRHQMLNKQINMLLRWWNTDHR